MLTVENRTRSGACRSCGAYGNSQPQSCCQPDRVVEQPDRVLKQGRFRRARRDRRTSAAILEYARIQEDLIRGV